MTEQSVKERNVIINQFDQALTKLINEKNYFVNQCKDAVEKESTPVKIYSLSFNFAWTLRYTIDCTQKYDSVIRNSLLDDRFDNNLANKQWIENEFFDFIPFIDNLEQSAGLVPHEVEKSERDHYERLKEKEDIANVQVDFWVDFCKDLAANGHHIAPLIKVYYNRLVRMLTDITVIRVSRKENDLRFLFERELKEYTSTDEWEDMSNSFIESIIKMRFRGIEPGIEELELLRSEEYSQMMTLKSDLGQFEAFLYDYTKLAKHLISKEVKGVANNHILQLLGHLSILQLVDDWMVDFVSEGKFMVPPDEDDTPLTYTVKLSEKRMKKLWPQIESLFKERAATDWVCFFHVLVFKNYVTCNSFKSFVVWLNNFAGRNLISAVNARQIKMSYWAKNAKRQWTIEDLHKWKNTARIDSRYKDFYQLCEDINNIIK